MALKLTSYVHRLIGVSAASALFVVTAGGALVLHGNFPSTRRCVGALTTELLAGVFEGRLVVDAIDRIGFDGVDIGRVRAIDPQGRTVIVGNGLHARVAILSIVEAVLRSGPLVVRIPYARLDDAEVVLDIEPSTDELGLVEMFTPRASKTPPTEPSTPGRVVRVELPELRLRHGWAHGDPGAGVLIDADVSEVAGHLFVNETEGVTLDIERSGVVSRLLPPLMPSGTSDYHLRVPKGEVASAMWASFTGEVGAVPVTASARLEGGRLTGQAVAPRATPAQLRTIVGDLPLREEASASARVDGVLPDLRITGEITTGAGRVTTTGIVRPGTPTSYEFDASARDVDLRSLFEGAPPVSVAVDSHAVLTFEPTGLRLKATANSQPTAVGGQAVPGATWALTYDEAGLHGDATLAEPGLPTRVKFDLDRQSVATVDAEVHGARLARVTRLGGAVSGDATVRVRGKVDLGAGQLGLNVDGTFSRLEASGATLTSARLSGRLTGPIASPEVEASVEGEGLGYAGTEVEHTRLRVSGPAAHPHVSLALLDPRWQELTLDADISNAAPFELTRVTAALHADELVVNHATVSDVDVGGGGVTLRGIHIASSGGTVDGTLTLHAGGIDADLDAALVLPPLSRALLPKGDRFTAGKLGLGLHVKSTGRGGHQGRATAHLDGVEFDGVPVRVGLDAEVDLHDTRATAAYAGRAVSTRGGSELVTAQGDAAATVRGALLEPATWREATGRVELRELAIDVGNVYDNDFVKALLFRAPLTPRARGKVTFGVALERDVAGAEPSVRAMLKTSGLVVTLAQSPKADAAHTTPTVIRGLDLIAGVSATVDAHRRGEPVTLDAGVRVKDEVGPLVDAVAHSEGSTRAVYGDLIALLDDGERRRAALERLGALTLGGRVLLNERPLAQWPSFVRPAGVKGTLAAAVDLGGTVARPEANATVRVAGITAAVSDEPWPVDGAITAHFGRDHTDVWGQVQHAGQEVLSLKTSADVSLAGLVTPAAAGPRWRASAELAVHDLRLEALPFVAPYGIGGRLSGTIGAEGLHDSPEVQFELSLARGKAVGGEFPRGSVRGRLSSRGGSVVTVALEQAGTVRAPRGGSLSATAIVAPRFADGLVPSLDPRQAQTFAVRVDRFQVTPFAPLTEPILADLGGYVTGEATLSIPGAIDTKQSPRGKLEGSFVWREGVLLVPQIGQTFTRGQFDLVVETKGDEAELHVAGLSLAATTGRVRGSAEVVVPVATVAHALTGVGPSYAGRDLFTVRGALAIAESEKIPVTYEGVPIGDAHGRVEVLVHGRPGKVDVTAAIPSLTMELPESSTRNLQDLSSLSDVGVVDRRYRDVGSLKRDGDAPPITLTVGLGDDLAGLFAHKPSAGIVTVRRSGTDVRLRGRPVVTFTDQMRISGTVLATRGRVTALGKPFVLEEGYVRFEGDDPSDPFVKIIARWDSPDGTRVYVDVVGNLKDAQPHFRTDPPRSESEALSLVLFGRDPNAAATAAPGLTAQQQQQAQGGVALGGASTVLNTLLDPVEVFGRRLETRVDTSSVRDTRVGVATEVRQNLWLQFNFSTVSQQTRQTADAADVALDWRFRRNWSLRTSVGNAGSTAFDLLWHYRY